MFVQLDISLAARCSRAAGLGRGWAIGLVYVEGLLVLMALTAGAFLFPLPGAILAGYQVRILFKTPRIMLHGDVVRKFLVFSLIFAVLMAVVERWAAGAEIGFAIIVLFLCGVIFTFKRQARTLAETLSKIENRQALENCFFSSRGNRDSLLEHMLTPRFQRAIPSLAGAIALLGAGIALSIGFEKNFVIFAAIAASYLIYRARRHLARPAEEARTSDDRPPVLILRSFHDDKLTTERFSPVPTRSFEQIVAKVMQEAGPPIVIGDPRESLPRLGAYRHYARDEDWKSVVASLMDESACLLFLLGDSANLFWEFQQALAKHRETDSLIVIPPLKAEVRQERWERFVIETRNMMNDRLPQRLPNDAFLAVFFRHGTPVFISAKKHTVAAYRLVLRLFLSIRNEGISSSDEFTHFLQQCSPLIRMDAVESEQSGSDSQIPAG
jgi:hypothetical protein